MFGFRFSLAQMAVMMVIVCLGCAAIVSANSVIASICLTVFFIANLVALTGSFTSTGLNRAFWIGMAVFGWAYWWQHEPVLLREDYSNRYRYSGYPYAYFGGLTAYSGDGVAPPPKLSSEWLLDRLYKLSARAPKVGDKVVARWMGGSFFPGIVKEIAEDGNYIVQWDDGSSPSPVPARDTHSEGGGYYITGHSVFGVFFGLLGGVLGLCFFGSKLEEPATPVPAANGSPPTGPVPAV
jgi:hypothetical protein